MVSLYSNRTVTKTVNSFLLKDYTSQLSLQTSELISALMRGGIPSTLVGLLAVNRHGPAQGQTTPLSLHLLHFYNCSLIILTYDAKDPNGKSEATSHRQTALALICSLATAQEGQAGPPFPLGQPFLFTLFLSFLFCLIVSP